MLPTMQSLAMKFPTDTSGLQPALFNPEMSILIQKCDPYTGNLERETSGDSTNAFLHWGDFLGPRHNAVC